jgi:hypothetical protein
MTEITSKAALMAGIDQEWSTYRAAVEAVDPDLRDLPGPFGWSIKDVVANITGWELEVVAILQGQPPHEAMGLDAATYEAGDTDVINGVIYAHNRRRSVADVIARADATHDEFRSLIDRLSWEELRRPQFGDQEPPSNEDRLLVLDWVTAAIFDHYRDHMRDISVIAGTVAAQAATDRT